MTALDLILFAQQNFGGQPKGFGGGTTTPTGPPAGLFAGMMVTIIIFVIIYLLIIAVVIGGMWKAFAKAGQPGWAAIVPVYNIFIMGELSGRGGMFGILTLVAYVVCAPVGLVMLVMLMIDFAKAYGQGAGFGVGLTFLGFIFFPILGFGSSEYVGASGGGSKRRRIADDDDDDRPRRRRDEDDDDDRPRRKPRRDDY